MAFIRPVQRSFYSVFNPQDLKFLTRLQLGLSHLNKHRFGHNFRDCINPLWSCSLEVENMLHFFLHCHHYSIFRMGLMNKVNQIDESFSYLSDDNKVSPPTLQWLKIWWQLKQFHLMSSLSYLYFRDRKTFDFPLPKWCLKFYFSLTLIVLSSPVTLFALNYCLGFLFTIVFTFPFLVTKYWLGHSWMYFILDFRSV